MSMEKLQEYLKTIDDVIANGEYKDDWDSLKNHKTPDWYRAAKFGIFIHWGVYSVPAFGNEWYPRFMYREHEIKKGKDYFQHHIDTYGPHKNFGYKDFIPMFKAEKFDASKWADLFEEAGAKFVMPVAEHHDGFQMYDSELSDWCATKMGPKKDIVGELRREIEKRGMTFTASSHRVEHYWFMNGGREFDSDFDKDIKYGDMYWPSMPREFSSSLVSGFEVDELFMQDWLARTCEIVDKYQPKMVFFDWWIQVEAMKPYLKKFAAYYYNRAKEWGKEVTINYKNDAYMYGTATRDFERGQLSEIAPDYWQTDTSVAKNSWCYTEGNDYKKPYSIIQDLVDIVSKNGALLLNIGPKADGTIPDEDAAILKDIGAWLKVNGEAIYGTHYWKKYGEGPVKTKEGGFTDTLREEFTIEDFRFTSKGDTIYAFAMKWPEDGVVRIKSLGVYNKVFNGLIKSVEVLGAPKGCTYKRCNDYLSVSAEGIETKNPVCIKVKVD